MSHKCDEEYCKHETVKYCDKCGKTYCEDCDMEWGDIADFYFDPPINTETYWPIQYTTTEYTPPTTWIHWNKVYV